MLVALVKAALMSSTAFFIEAAANTVTVGSWAAVGRGAAAMVAIVRATARDLKDVNIVALHWGGGRNRAQIRAPCVGGPWLQKRPIRKRRSGPSDALTALRGSQAV